MTPRPKTPARWLRDKFTGAGLSQKLVAEELGIGAPQLNRWLKEGAGAEGVPSKYVPLLANALSLLPHERATFQTLCAIEDWTDALNSTASEKSFVKFGIPGRELSRILLSHVDRLSEIDFTQDASVGHENIYLDHISSCVAATKTVSYNVFSQSDALFSISNVRRHIKYPINYYMGILMMLDDRQIMGGDKFSMALRLAVQNASDFPHADKFLGRLARQHARHMQSRYSPTPAPIAYPKKLANSDDIQDQRMVMFGLALSPHASSQDWATLHDRYSDEQFQRAAALFDAAHYDNMHLSDDGWPEKPDRIHRTVLRIMSGLDNSDPHLREFSAKRLQALLGMTTQDMIVDPAIATRVQHVLETRDDTISGMAKSTLEIIHRKNKEGL